MWADSLVGQWTSITRHRPEWSGCEYSLARDRQRKMCGSSDGASEVEYKVATKMRELDFSGGGSQRINPSVGD